MGAAASFDNGLALQTQRPCCFCHACHRIIDSDALANSAEFCCLYCGSTFLESVEPFVERAGLQGLTIDQARRFAHSTAMLRLLEHQLREELEFLRSAFEQMNQRASRASLQSGTCFTKVMQSKLRMVTVDLDLLCSQPSCPICSEEFFVGGSAQKLPCTHLFHRSCILPWLELKQNCPICRKEISDDIPELMELSTFSIEELIAQLRGFDVLEKDISSTCRSDLEQLLLSKLEDYQLTAQESSTDVQALAHSPPRFMFTVRNHSSSAGQLESTTLVHRLGAAPAMLLPAGDSDDELLGSTHRMHFASQAGVYFPPPSASGAADSNDAPVDVPSERSKDHQ